MLLVAVEVDLIVEAVHIAIHAGTREASLADLFKDRLIRPLACAYQRREDKQAGTIGKLFDLVHDLLRGLFHHLTSTNWTMRDTRTREQKPHVVIDFGNGTDRRTGIMRCGFLINRDGGGESIYIVHIGLIHLPDELARVGRQRFHITPLTLCKNRVECQRRFA